MATPNMLTAAAAGTEETARFDALGPIGAPKRVALSPIGAPKLMEESDDAGTLGAAVEAMVLVLVLVQVLLEVKVLLEVFSRSLQAPELIMLLGTRLIRRDALAGTLAASSRYSSPVCSFFSCSPKVVFPPSLISVMISLRRPTRMEELLFNLIIAVISGFKGWRDLAGLLRMRPPAAMDPRIRQAIALMRDDLARELDVDDLATRSGLSRAHFFSLFQRDTQVTPLVYANVLRFETAVRRLSLSNEPVSDVALDLGF
jgi:AraC-like DNA-binding protein